MRIDLIRALQNDLEIALQSVLPLEWSGCKVRTLKIFVSVHQLCILDVASLLCFLEILIIHEEKTKEITSVRRFGCVILIIIKFGELLLFNSPRINLIIK